jgi:hypothetical protein
MFREAPQHGDHQLPGAGAGVGFGRVRRANIVFLLQHKTPLFAIPFVGSVLAAYIEIDGHNLSSECGGFIFAQPPNRCTNRALAFSLGRMLGKCVDYRSKFGAVLLWNVIDLEAGQVLSSGK